MCFPPSFGSFAKAVTEKKIFRNNQKQEWPVVAMFINGWELNAQFL
jgi:hypothetical protein